jgi:hypothetical protein
MPSTVIELFNYDHRASTLTIVFRSGNVYAYLNVPELVYRNLQAAPSKGKYFNTAIRDKFRYQHINKAK